MNETKTDKVRRLVKQGDYKAALGIARNFRRGISVEDSNSMKLGYESMVHQRFYQSIGIDTAQAANMGVETLLRLYGA